MAAENEIVNAEHLASKHDSNILGDGHVWQQLMRDGVVDSKQHSSANPAGDFINMKNLTLSSTNYDESSEEALEIKHQLSHSDVEDIEPTVQKQSIHRRSNRTVDHGRVEALDTESPPTRHLERAQNSEVSRKRPLWPRTRVPLHKQNLRLSRLARAYVCVSLQEWRRIHLAKLAAAKSADKIEQNCRNDTDCNTASALRASSPVAVDCNFVVDHKENDDIKDDVVPSLIDELDGDLDNVTHFGNDISSSSSDEEGYRLNAQKRVHLADSTLSTQSGSRLVSTLMLTDSSEDGLKNPSSLLAPSLFPNVPPYLAFSSNTTKGPEVPPELRRILKWRVSSAMPKVVRRILANSGMCLLKRTHNWMGVWEKHLKAPCFRTIRPYQKINHLPASFIIGRKDSLWRNLKIYATKYGKKEYGFMPKTYIIPDDLTALRGAWRRYARRNAKWIIKPPASARGAGISVVSKWSEIPKMGPFIVQRYIERPLLINGSKFDLRLYVLVTSMNPLRIYLYHNGLARFASVKYSNGVDTLNDRCMHLTNYSINKLSSNYEKNGDFNACNGHKWTIQSLWNYFASRGVCTDHLWEAIRSLIIRTLLIGESHINHTIRSNVESKYSVYELFGFDILLDADLIPWLLEVNISPSLHSDLPLDAHVKAPLVQAVLNTALYNIPPKLSPACQREIAAKMSYHTDGPICHDERLYINYLSHAELVKHNEFTCETLKDRDEYLSFILECLTPDDVRCLLVAEDELERSAPLERIFPTKDTHEYLKFYDRPLYYNRLMDAWESRYANDRQAGIDLLRSFCLNRYHLQVPPPPPKKQVVHTIQTLGMPRVSGLYLAHKWPKLRQTMKAWQQSFTGLKKSNRMKASTRTDSSSNEEE